MTPFRLGCVVTAGPDRLENLLRTLSCLDACSPSVDGVVVVLDGWYLDEIPEWAPEHWLFTHIEKHQPGREQPRNVGVRHLRAKTDDTHVWFLDSDLVFEPDLVQRWSEGHAAADVDRILIGPYEWLAPGETAPREDLHNDIRWASFNESGPERVFTHDLGAGLGCFSGNLVWPVEAFARAGGFHPELHHGRCEDGELGLRAASLGVPMSLVRTARAWHVAHQVNHQWCIQANARDVPLLNSFHPWVQDQGLLLTEKDGARFDFQCPECGTRVNSADYWEHWGSHLGHEPHYNDPASVEVPSAA